jgi:hypothetical protein
MKYRYDHRSATPTAEGIGKVADIYIVRGGPAWHAAPSPEPLAATERLSPEAQALMRGD